jgi:hypothetical protein
MRPKRSRHTTFGRRVFKLGSRLSQCSKTLELVCARQQATQKVGDLQEFDMLQQANEMHWRYRLRAYIKDEEKLQTARNRMIIFNEKYRTIVMLTGAGAAPNWTKTLFTSEISTRLWSLDDKNLRIRRQYLASIWGFQCWELLRASITLGWFNVTEFQESVHEAFVILMRFSSISTTRIYEFDVSILPWCEVFNAKSFYEFLSRSNG